MKVESSAVGGKSPIEGSGDEFVTSEGVNAPAVEFVRGENGDADSSTGAEDSTGVDDCSAIAVGKAVGTINGRLNVNESIWFEVSHTDGESHESEALLPPETDIDEKACSYAKRSEGEASVRKF